MIVSPIKKIAVWATLVLYFFIGLFSTSEAVLCVGPKGHLSVEQGQNGQCIDKQTPTLTHQKLSVGTNCEHCHDVPLSTLRDVRSSLTPATAMLGLGVSHTLPLVEHQIPHSSCIISAVQLANPPPMRPACHTILKTVIIQI